MLRSLMTAVTGVRSHQTMLDVTGNNIANVNTTGYKKDYTIFQDLLYQTTQGATAPGDARGGVNPAQVGLGVKVAAIETLHSQGATQFTGNKSDMLISGEGYFVLRNGTSRIYSRAGNFALDGGSNLVHSGTGYSVQGYKMERDPLNPTQFVKSSEIVDIRIPLGSKMEARATTTVGYKCNLDSQAAAYLPNGYADIASTKLFAEGGGELAKVKIDGIEYEMTFKTNLNSTNGEGYLTVTIDARGNSAAAPTIVFDMSGIKDGLPVLVPQNLTVLLNGLTPSGPELEVKYDPNTGTLKLQNPSTHATAPGATVWETNLQKNMNYATFTLTVTSGSDYNFIGEFDESDLAGSPTTLTLWYTLSSGGVEPMKATVSFKADGTFDTVSPLSGTFPGNFTADNFKIAVSANGSALEIQVAKDLNAPAPIADNLFDTVTQIIQGGFHQTKLTVYDCQGYPYTLEVQMKKIASNLWRWEAFFPDYPQLAPTPRSGEMTFDASCHIVDP
ncbi:MAG: flagellar hook-basal body complex protein, partial [Synergistaceae bacterium]|nr:flagellar hook-basal body complex protein [Synergistaceae bacterium]